MSLRWSNNIVYKLRNKLLIISLFVKDLLDKVEILFKVCLNLCKVVKHKILKY